MMTKTLGLADVQAGYLLYLTDAELHVLSRALIACHNHTESPKDQALIRAIIRKVAI
jgi:hypothetical protein